jgi:hypothetical protein
MKAYFACSSAGLKKHIDHYVDLTAYVESLGVEISDNWILKVSTKMKNPDYDPDKRSLKKADIQKEGLKSIKKSDVLVADLSVPSASVGYQVSYAIDNGLSVLCIYSLDFGLKKIPQIISSIDSPLLTTAAYKDGSYKETIRKFLGNSKKKELVKFNFVATREIVKYLDWLSTKRKMTKSAVLREEIEKKMITVDKNYLTNKS